MTNIRLSFITVVSCLCFLTIASTASADSFSIQDSTSGDSTYWGGVIRYNNVDYASPTDVWGDVAHYAVDSLTVNRTSTSLSATLTGSYFSSGVNEYAGDLFLSTDGWSAYSTGITDTHHASDTSAVGSWEYVLHRNTNGSISLYAVDNTKIVTSDAISAGPNVDTSQYRTGQEVYYNPGSQLALGTGSWSISGNSMNFTLTGLTLSQFNLDGILGVHWTMSCGNDVIEGQGGSQVPEPATLILFGAGILGLAGARARSKK